MAVHQAPSPRSTSTATRKPVRWPSIIGPRFWLLLLFVTALLLARLAVVQGYGITLYMDEAQYWDWSRHLDWGFHDKPPLIVALVAASTALFGSGELGVKALAMVLYPITALCLVGLARALWPTSSGVRTGIVAAAVFMSLPAVGLLGLLATTDAPLMLCWTLAAWALWRAQVTDRLGYWAALGVALGLGMLSKYSMAAFGVTMIWALWGIHGPRKGIFRLGPWLSVAVALLVMAPHLIWNAQHGYPTLQYTAQAATQADQGGGLMAGLSYLMSLVIMFGPVTLLAALWLWRRPVPAVSMPRPGGDSSPPQTGAPSRWAATTQLSSRLDGASGPPSTMVTQPGTAGAVRRPMAKGSAYYLAAFSSYRFLWACSLPLLLVGVIQAFYAQSFVHWAAPSLVGLCLLVASRLSQPMIALAAPRPNAWLAAVLTANLLLTAGALHLSDMAGGKVSERLDVLSKLRGWDTAFQMLEPSLRDPVVLGLPLLASEPDMIAQSQYHLRHLKARTLFWNPTQTTQHHYAAEQSLPNRVGADVVLLSQGEADPAITSRFAWVRPLKDVTAPAGPGREVRMQLVLLRGFLGYDDATYRRQSGSAVTPMETPVND
jgi:hypothetical protein